MAPTDPRTRVLAITRRLGLTHVVALSRMATAAQVPVKHTTQGPGPLPRLCKVLMPTEAGGARRLRKTAPLLTASIKPLHKEPQGRCTLRMGLQLMAHRVSTETALRSVRPQMATSMRPRTAIPTRTPGAAGAAIRTILRNPAHQAGDLRKRAAGHRPSAAVVGGGDRSRKVPVVRQVEAVVVVGAAAAEGEPRCAGNLSRLGS